MAATVRFQGKNYKLQITNHAQDRMGSRAVDGVMVRKVLLEGTVKEKPDRPKNFWVYFEFLGRYDNLICLSVVIEGKSLILKTVLVNWRPE